MNERFYLLQFWKGDDSSSCTHQIEEPPPPVLTPVLPLDKEHYMGFNSLYGKMLITEKYCLSFQKKTERGQIKSESGYNFIASGVVTKIHCNLCNKQRCVFSSESYLSLSGEKYLEDDIYSCRMLLDSHNLCTQRNLHCISPIENAFYFKKEIAECISVHFGSLDVDAKAMIYLRKSFKNE